MAFVPIPWELENPTQYRYTPTAIDEPLEFIVTPAQALRAVRRTGNGLMDIIIIIPDNEKLQMDDVNDALEILGGRNTERWRTLRIKIKSASPLLALGWMRAARFTSLQEIELHNKCVPLIDSLNASATSLRSLLIRYRGPLGLGDYAHGSWWGQLNVLFIGGLWREELQELASIIEVCPLLKDLQLHDTKMYYLDRPYLIPSSWPPKILTGTSVTFHLLEDSWRCLSGLAIKKLHVEAFGEYSHDHWNTIVLPSVTYLICENFHALLTVARRCSFPSLITLELPSYEPSRRSKTWEDTMWAESTLTPRGLVVSVVSQVSANIPGGDILDRLTSLEEVKLTAEDARQLGYFLSRNEEFAKGGNRRLKLVECNVVDGHAFMYAKKAILKVEEGRRAGSGGKETTTTWVLKCNGTSEVVIESPES